MSVEVNEIFQKSGKWCKLTQVDPQTITAIPLAGEDLTTHLQSIKPVKKVTKKKATKK